jgi:hypothetical protein
VRNIFDQYSQPENRVTHALMTALDCDRALLGRFLNELVKVHPPSPSETLSVLEQQFPWAGEPSEEDLDRRGIPDGWICDEESAWCVFIETKVTAPLRAAQVRSHQVTAAQRGFHTVKPVVIVPHLSVSLSDDISVLEWRTVYAWLRRHSPRSEWASRAAAYLEIAEAKLIESERFAEGTLTMFAGFPFGPDHPYAYLEGKRLLHLAMNELRARRDLKKELGMNPDIPGRPAITGRNSEAVWDFLSLSSAENAADFTKYPHLTLGINAQDVEAMVTVPNNVNSKMRNKLVALGEDGFLAVAASVLKGLAPVLRKSSGAVPWFRGIQRRYPSQKSRPYIDARIDFDLRTAVPSDGGAKWQPQWLSAAYRAFVDKKGANYQIQIGILFPYSRCSELNRADVLDLIAGSWVACRPFVFPTH